MGGRTLRFIADATGRLAEVRKADLREGDHLFIKTLNSIYCIKVVGEGLFAVSGGWFARKGLDHYVTGITGCTWGGSAVKTDVVAACGLCLEFGNRLTTTHIQRIIHLRSACLN